jgi:hypothetical protein
MYEAVCSETTGTNLPLKLFSSPSRSAQSESSTPFFISGDTSLLSSNSTSPTPDVLSLDQTFKSGFKGHRDVVRSAFYDENVRSFHLLELILLVS